MLLYLSRYLVQLSASQHKRSDTMPKRRNRTKNEIRDAFCRRLLSLHCVYALCDPDTSVIRYIGCTMNPKARFSSHKTGREQTTGEWVRSLKAEGKTPVMKILYQGEWLHAYDVEKALIVNYRNTLLNRNLTETAEEHSARQYFNRKLKAIK